MLFSSREEIIAMTHLWTGERFEDGRPKVEDRYLDKIAKMTLEELWKPIYTKGYTYQFIAMRSLHPEYKADGSVNKKLVGRAVTAVYAPTRPDYYDAMMGIAKAAGRSGTPNQWVIDSLTERDVIVVDMYDKIHKGTFLGGNLTTAIKTKTKTGGGVIWGGIRDVEQMRQTDGVQVYYRGIDPTPIREFVMTGMNVPCRLGNDRATAICLPGDVVYGSGGGILFIPPHLAAEVVRGAAKTQVKDIFGFEMISKNHFSSAEIDRNVWTEEMLDMLTEFIKTEEKAADYRELDWAEDYELARSTDFSVAQSAL